jgi:hypothetical protein
VLGGLALEALPLAAYLVARAPAEGFLVELASGAGMVLVDVVTITALQRATPRELLGRVMGLALTALIGAQAVASLVIGPVVQSVGLTHALAGLAVVVPAVGVALCWPLLQADRRAAARGPSLEPRIALLARLDLFAGAGRPALERLAEALTGTDLPAGATLLREGDAADAVYLLAGGRLTVCAGGRRLPDVPAPG